MTEDLYKMRFNLGYHWAECALKKRPLEQSLAEFLHSPPHMPLRSDTWAFQDGYLKRCREAIEMAGEPIPEWAIAPIEADRLVAHYAQLRSA